MQKSSILLLLILCLISYCTGQAFVMPSYLNETRELMAIDISIVKGMTEPYSKHQIEQVIHDTYEFYSKLEDVCYMIESYDITGFRIYDEFMHKDQVGVLKIGPHCTAVDYNETVLVEKYHWSEENATSLIMNVRGILYSWNKLQQLRSTFVITTTTTTTSTTTMEPPTSANYTISPYHKSVNITRGPRITGQTRGTYKRRTTQQSFKHTTHVNNGTTILTNHRKLK